MIFCVFLEKEFFVSDFDGVVKIAGECIEIGLQSGEFSDAKCRGELDQERSKALFQWGKQVEEVLGFGLCVLEAFVVGDGAVELETKAKGVGCLLFPARDCLGRGERVERRVAFDGVEDRGIRFQKGGGFGAFGEEASDPFFVGPNRAPESVSLDTFAAVIGRHNSHLCDKSVTGEARFLQCVCQSWLTRRGLQGTTHD